MFCMHCGQQLPPDAVFCPNCGQKAETASDTSAGTSEKPPKIDCGFTLAVIAVVVGNVIGIVALIYAVLASNMLQSGDYEGARRAACTGKIWSWTVHVPDRSRLRYPARRREASRNLRYPWLSQPLSPFLKFRQKQGPVWPGPGRRQGSEHLSGIS